MIKAEDLAERFEDILDLETAANEHAPSASEAPPQPEPKRQRMNPGHAMMGAARIRAEAHGDDPFADRCEAQARDKLPAEQVRPGAGSELVPMAQAAENASLVLVDTLAKPDYVAADASRERLDLLNDAGALTIGLDVADTMEVRDSLERMLAHQLAALHVFTMKLAVQLNRATERLDVAGPDPRKRAAANVEACRLVGAVSRMSSTYQLGLGTLQRLRTGGKQTFVFQHNHVTEGGQAVIGGTVGGGGAPKRRGGSN